MSIITDEMVEKVYQSFAIRGYFEDHGMANEDIRAALEAVANDIIDRCIKEIEWVEYTEVGMSATYALRKLKTEKVDK